MLTIEDFIEAYNPCDDSIYVIAQSPTIKHAWYNLPSGSWGIWFLSSIGFDNKTLLNFILLHAKNKIKADYMLDILNNLHKMSIKEIYANIRRVRSTKSFVQLLGLSIAVRIRDTKYRKYPWYQYELTRSLSANACHYLEDNMQDIIDAFPWETIEKHLGHF